MSDIKELTEKIIKFRDERDWAQFHNPKDISITLLLEAAEVLEHFQWKNSSEMEEYVKVHRKEIADELADTLYCILLMASDLKIDIKKALEEKMKEIAKKYPIEKAKGKHTKYNKL